MLHVPRWAEAILWVIILCLAVGIRLYLIHLLPVALWSKDAGSYTSSAFDWMHSGVWETSPRRGAVYSLLIAACIKGFGSLHAVMICQHLLGALAIAATLAAARICLGRSSLIPLFILGLSLALYGLPLYFEHLLRNETLLFFFGSMLFASWFLAVRRHQSGWLWITGISAGLLALTKNVYGPLPLVLVAGYLYFFRNCFEKPAKQAALFVLAFALPLLGVKALNAFTVHTRPAEPQAGILFYGRTAQFTVLDAGEYPEIKAAIRQEVEDYRKRPRLDNNVILKLTVVPHLERILAAQGKSPADLNRLCWKLGLEGVNANRGAYFLQMLEDLRKVFLSVSKRPPEFSSSDLKNVREMLVTHDDPDPLMDVPHTVPLLDAAHTPGHFVLYRKLVSFSVVFRFGAVALTTLLLPWLFWRSSPAMRFWWLGLASVWFFNLGLLCTVGRPIDRYLIPVIPVMFWTLACAFTHGWAFVGAKSGSASAQTRAQANTNHENH
ncbi:MAG: hypothetical protein WCO68_05815 [Verrucomicrobiota bacterium]